MSETYTYNEYEGFTFLENIPDEDPSHIVKDHDFGGKYDTQFRAPMVKRVNDANQAWQQARMIPSTNQVPTYVSHPSTSVHTDVAGHLANVWEKNDFGPMLPIRQEFAVDKNRSTLGVQNDTRVHMLGFLDTQTKDTPLSARTQFSSSFDHEVAVAPWTDNVHTFTNMGMSTSTAMVLGGREGLARAPGGGPLVNLPRDRAEQDTVHRTQAHTQTLMEYRPVPSFPQADQTHHMIGERDTPFISLKATMETAPVLPNNGHHVQFDTYHTGQVDDTDRQVIEPGEWY